MYSKQQNNLKLIRGNRIDDGNLKLIHGETYLFQKHTTYIDFVKK